MKIFQYWIAAYLLMVLSLVTGSSSFAQKDAAPINPAVPKALYLLETEQTKKALAELEQAVKDNPLDASLLYYLGYAQLKTGAQASALASFEKGIQVNEKEPLNYVGVGHVRLLEKKPTEAKPQFDKALSMTRSKNVTVLKAIAESYLVDNRYSVDAISLLNRAKSINDSDPGVYMLLGDTYLLQNSGGNVGPALSSYETAITTKQLDPTAKARSDAKANYKIGVVYEKTRNNEVAQESYSKAITADPNYTPAYKELGEIYYLNKESAKAVTAYEKFLQLTENPETPQYQYQYAFFIFMSKDYKKANEIFGKIANEKNVTATTLRFYAVSLYEEASEIEKTEKEKAIELFKKSSEIFERYFTKVNPLEIAANDYMYYGKSLLKLAKGKDFKQDSLGIIALQKSLALDKDQPDVLLLIANAYFKTKRFAQSIVAYKQLMSLRKTPFASDIFAIGVAYYDNNEFEPADSSFAKLIELQPKRIEGYAWQARTKANLEDSKKEPGLAKPYFEKLMEMASENPVRHKRELIECYQYLSFYFYSQKQYAESKSIYEKWLELDPNNKDIIDSIDTIKKIENKK